MLPDLETASAARVLSPVPFEYAKPRENSEAACDPGIETMKNDNPFHGVKATKEFEGKGQ